VLKDASISASASESIFRNSKSPNLPDSQKILFFKRVWVRVQG
jgi:hypothetical protein